MSAFFEDLDKPIASIEDFPKSASLYLFENRKIQWFHPNDNREIVAFAIKYSSRMYEVTRKNITEKS